MLSDNPDKSTDLIEENEQKINMEVLAEEEMLDEGLLIQKTSESTKPAE